MRLRIRFFNKPSLNCNDIRNQRTIYQKENTSLRVWVCLFSSGLLVQLSWYSSKCQGRHKITGLRRASFASWSSYRQKHPHKWRLYRRKLVFTWILSRLNIHFLFRLVKQWKCSKPARYGKNDVCCRFYLKNTR